MEPNTILLMLQQHLNGLERIKHHLEMCAKIALSMNEIGSASLYEDLVDDAQKGIDVTNYRLSSFMEDMND